MELKNYLTDITKMQKGEIIFSLLWMDFPMISLSRYLPLICRKATEFCLLILYPGALLNEFISCKIMFLGNGIYLLSLKTL